MEFIIDEFEGPLDLLLHLIKESKMDIFDIKIDSITDQYLEYINKQESLNLEVSSEYLVLASELIELKSKLLLPTASNNDEEEEYNPEEELINRLLEYQAYQEVSKLLKEKEAKRKDIHTKIPENLNNYLEQDKKIELNVELDDLVNAFKDYLERKELEKPLKTKIATKELSVSSRKKEILDIFKTKNKVSFYELFSENTKPYLVVTFLAVLELVKKNKLLITQEQEFEEIICEVYNG